MAALEERVAWAMAHIGVRGGQTGDRGDPAGRASWHK
jgi:hypothetical protein